MTDVISLDSIDVAATSILDGTGCGTGVTCSATRFGWLDQQMSVDFTQVIQLVRKYARFAFILATQR